MPTNHTPHFNLNQWERDDRILMDDFNADNAKIDAALKSGADARAALQGALNRKGNCSIGVFTYNGTGKYGPDNPTRITFPRVPAAYIVVGSALLVGGGGSTRASLSYSFGGYGHTYAQDVSWSGNTLSLFSSDADRQMNTKENYTVIAFYTTA